MKLRQALLTSTAGALLATAADAQSFNIDFGDLGPFGICSSAYGAAAGQPGEWNGLYGGWPYAFTLKDLAGTLTTVTTDVVHYGNGSGDWSQDNPATTGDDEKLLDDLADCGSGTSITYFHFDGLANGFYDVYTYAIAPDDPTHRTKVWPEGSGDIQYIGGQWMGSHAQGVSYALHCVQVTTGHLVMTVQVSQGWGSCNGVQLVQRSTPCSGTGTAYCFGNSADGNACPCGNDNDGTAPKGGCQHDDSPAGARLDASGQASVGNDTLVFLGTRGPISNSTLFFQGNNNLDGAGAFLGDGIRCAGGGLIRLKVKTTDANGSADSSPMVVTARSASFGHVIQPGETLYYQWWIRDSGGSICGSENNTSNGYEVTWTP